MSKIHGLRFAFAVSGMSAGMQRATVAAARLAVVVGRSPGCDGYIRRVARETTKGPTEASEGASAAINAGHEDLVRATGVCSAAPLRLVAVGNSVGHFVDPAFVPALEASAASLEFRTPPEAWVIPPSPRLFEP